ncbi:heme ABC exporter ATP-binding protein CcmA [Maritalea sp.]|uniref:heme ABC exporter ATP-binding protein CcmA n=1 Tax=Maritalea sp. TaxID=2003361 RepID=UPI003EF0ED59
MADTEQMAEKTSIKVRELSCSRSGFVIFAGVSFNAMPGEVILLRGPNGAGKSTCLAALHGALTPSDGIIDIELDDDERSPRELLHVIGHVPGVKTTLTVRENLQFWADLYGSADNIDLAIDAAGLHLIADSDAAILSAGQTRRLALARLLVAERPIWILDEPTSALDKQGEGWVGDLIASHANKGGIIIAATHLDIPNVPKDKIKTVMINGALA